jgi:restriction endonuclease S subunit
MSERSFAPGDRSVIWINFCDSKWSFKPIKYGCRINEKALPENTSPDFEIQYIDISSVNSNGHYETSEPMKFEDAPSRARRIVSDGDVIISTVRTYLRAIAYIEKTSENLICSTGFAVLSPKIDINPTFLSYWVRSQYFVDEIVARSVGVSYPAINAPEIGSLPFPSISKKLQNIIASFLDRETSRIDALIDKKERQIELLNEKRLTIISQAVTKGLNPKSKMKDSCIEWLGEIPEHWGIIRLKYLLSKPLQYGANESAEFDEPSWPRFVRITDIDENGTLREETFKSLPYEVAQPYLLNKGDLLFARSGATVGKTFLYDESWGIAAYAGYLIRASFNMSLMIPTFASYFCRSFNYWDWLNSSFIQATIQNVSAEKYANLILPLPSTEEQKEIVSVLNFKTSSIDQIIHKVSLSIKKLREYRTALITAAVTGKIDVSKEAPDARPSHRSQL